jgi:hypothetical protein
MVFVSRVGDDESARSRASETVQRVGPAQPHETFNRIPKTAPRTMRGIRINATAYEQRKSLADSEGLYNAGRADRPFLASYPARERDRSVTQKFTKR